MQNQHGEQAREVAELRNLKRAATFGISMHPMSFGMHMRLMLHYYALENPLPNERESLQRIAGATSRAQRADLQELTTHFWTERSDGLVPGHKDLRLAQHARAETSQPAQVIEIPQGGPAPEPPPNGSGGGLVGGENA